MTVIMQATGSTVLPPTRAMRKERRRRAARIRRARRLRRRALGVKHVATQTAMTIPGRSAVQRRRKRHLLAKAHTFSGGQFGGVLSSVIARYKKLKKGNLLSSKSPNSGRIAARLIAIGTMLGGVRAGLWKARKKGLDTKGLEGQFEVQRQRTNQMMRGLQQLIKSKTGKHVKMPYVNPVGGGGAINFAGNDGFGISPAGMISAAKGALKKLTLPAKWVKNVLGRGKQAEAFANSASKLLDEIAASDLPIEEKIALAKETKEVFVEETGDEEEEGFLAKIKQKVYDALGITAAKETAKKVMWGAGIAAILATTWYIYRRTQGKPFIPALGSGLGGFMGDQQSKMQTCNIQWRRSEKRKGRQTHKEFMSDCLSSKEQGMLGGLGMFGGTKPKRPKRRKKGKRKARRGGFSAAFSDQQSKMQTCNIEWREDVKPRGRKTHKQFMKTCLKG